MNEESHPPKFVENTVLLVSGILAHAPLYFQLPRWVHGLDPTFIHPKWIASSSFPFVMYMAAVHPIFWLGVTALVFWRICRNYGWRLERGL